MLGIGTAQAALAYGADDIDGTVRHELIYHDAGATTPEVLSVEHIQRLIREAGREPVERDTLYRQVMTDYHGFAADRHEPAALDPATRAGLEESLRPYLDARGLSADWEAVQSADDEALVTTLASVLPFEPAEKQALLETITLAERAQTLSTLMSFAASPGPSGLQ